MKKTKLSENQIEKRILSEIKKSREPKKTFSQLISKFEAKYKSFNPKINCFNINDYFKTGNGFSTASKELRKDKRIKENWLKNVDNEEGEKRLDFKGLYVFIHENTPFYVGISKGVIGRILQHTKGRSHFTSTLGYRMGLIRYKIINKKEYVGTRKDFEFVKYVTPIKKILLNQKIAWINIDNDEELYLFEAFCAMKLETSLNDFKTH